ncbi:MetdephydrolaseC [Aspergillus parasiticus SU-1]|uniref:MetdephydrolaseC n=1 Tax=Aspergillus parasiticus (strain ATCC 56775 / NRRL 5862 / SRRC 143 / SU-1) TaxID=1403190 RepID=A0A0F0IDG2_ASPPU|nr:MetdephydrolaseC [Aspergillus parasiticus SU-1]
MATKGTFLATELIHQEFAQRSRLRRLRRWRRPLWTLLLIAVFVALIQGESKVNIVPYPLYSTESDLFNEGINKCYEARSRSQSHNRAASESRVNHRWNPVSGQKEDIVIQNATLFDGESTRNGTFDIHFSSGVIRSVSPTHFDHPIPEGAHIINVHGRCITPGLVDMHSHHLLLPFPQLPATNDVNERPLLGPITPFVRAIDGFKPYDPTIKIIASGGVTSSLVLPGSANIVGGEAYMVKNLPLPGAAGEPIVEELLLEYGLPENNRQRYLKMACGENPKRVYGNTRLGLTWLLRKSLEEARDLHERQSAWCRAAFDVEETSFAKTHHVKTFIRNHGKRPESFELETLVALIRGELNVNVHCYEPEDLERMLSVLHEFGVHPQAFHHALEAWQVPELLKNLEENITIATFAENALFKAEAYGANLRGPKILDDHGVKVALKSDHTGEDNYAKYLMYQAAVSHSFGLSEDKSLQAVTSIPARSVQQDHRIGYVRPGYDADLIVWDDHPLQVGATPLEVFIDGRAVLGNSDSLELLIHNSSSVESPGAPAPRPSILEHEKEDICSRVHKSPSKLLFTGIKKVLVDTPISLEDTSDVVLLIEDGKVVCLNKRSTCLSSKQEEQNVTEFNLNEGYITPGLVAFGNNIGIQDIPSEESTGDGSSSKGTDALNGQKSLHFAKYGVHLRGRAFTRAKIGGVTKAITAPRSNGGIIQGVSVGDDTPTVASGVEHVRQILQAGQEGGQGSASIYVQAANGSIPVVVRAYNEDDISQLVLIKHDFPSVKLVIHGGHGAVSVAKHLAEENIPVILTGNRGAPTNWEKKDVLTGPPLTESPAKILTDAGVLLGLGVSSDSKVHGLAQEARWAGKFAGLSDRKAIALVSTNIEAILGIGSKRTANGGEDSQRYRGDFVVWEGDPLRGEGSVVVSVQDGEKIADCWPDTSNVIL